MDDSVFKLKRDCHFLMEEIWGFGHDARAMAYSWLESTFGMEIHFSKVDDLATLKRIHERLISYKLLLDNQKYFDVFRERNQRRDKVNIPFRKKIKINKSGRRKRP